MRYILLVIALLLHLCGTAQVTVVYDYEGKQEVADPENYTLSGSTEHTVIVKHFVRIDTGQRADLTDVLLTKIHYYLDEAIVIGEDRMEIRYTPKEMDRELKRMVDEEIDRYGYQVDEAFEGFSEELSQKIATIERLNWMAPADGQDTGAIFDQRAMAINYARAQIRDLKAISARDLDLYARLHVHQERDADDNDPELAFVDDRDTFRLNDPLAPFVFKIYPESTEDIGMYVKPEVRVDDLPKGTDDDIVALVKSNNELIKLFGEQMISLQEQLLEIKRESVDQQRQFAEIRSEITGLHMAIDEINENNSYAVERTSGRAVSSLTDMVFRFEKNSTELSLVDKSRLNALAESMRRDEDLQLKITGHADRSGTPELNARISRDRARAVRDYLSVKSISRDRLIIDFMGAELSTSENAEDRKVVVELLTL